MEKENIELKRALDHKQRDGEASKVANRDALRKVSDYSNDLDACRKKYDLQLEATRRLERKLNEAHEENKNLVKQLGEALERTTRAEKRESDAQRDLKRCDVLLSECHAAMEDRNQLHKTEMESAKESLSKQVSHLCSRESELTNELDEAETEISLLQAQVTALSGKTVVIQPQTSGSSSDKAEKSSSSGGGIDPPNPGGNGKKTGSGGGGGGDGDDDDDDEDDDNEGNDDHDDDDERDKKKSKKKEEARKILENTLKEYLRKREKKLAKGKSRKSEDSSAKDKAMESALRKLVKSDDDGSSSDSESEDESDDDSSKGNSGRVVVKNTQAEKVVVPKFPSIVGLPRWKQHIARNLCVACGKWDSKEIQWILEVEKDGKSIDDFVDSGALRFKQLDIRFAVSLASCIKEGCPELDRVFQRKEAECMREKGRCLKGRQIYFMILDYFRTNSDMSVVYTVQDLTGLEWLGDKNMHSFRHYWDAMTQKVRNELNESTLADILLAKLEKSVELKEDIRHYQRQREGHEDKTYSYLLGCMDRHLARQRLLKNRTDHQAAMKRNSPAVPGETNTGGDGNKKKKKKKKRAKSEPVRKNENREEPVAAAPKDKKKKKNNSRENSQNRDGPARDKSPGGTAPQKRNTICWFYQSNKCENGKDCAFEHVKVDKSQLSQLKRRGRSTSPKGKGKGGGKGKNNRDTSAPRMGQYCRAFLKPGGCPNPDKCKYPHCDEAQVEEIKRAHRSAMKEYESKKKGGP